MKNRELEKFRESLRLAVRRDCETDKGEVRDRGRT